MARVIRRSKTTPRVKDGRVQRKHYRDVEWGDRPLEILTRVPGLGHRHVLTRELVERFIALVPDWSELSRGLHTILLAEASSRADGWYNDGFIALPSRCAPSITRSIVRSGSGSASPAGPRRSSSRRFPAAIRTGSPRMG